MLSQIHYNFSLFSIVDPPFMFFLCHYCCPKFLTVLQVVAKIFGLSVACLKVKTPHPVNQVLPLTEYFLSTMNWSEHFLVVIAQPSQISIIKAWTIATYSIISYWTTPYSILQGQIRPKAVWACSRFSQKTNKWICFVCRGKQKSKQNKFVCLFFGRIYGAPIFFWFYLTFNAYHYS